jgi:signal transduction histidine kinase
MIALPAVDTSHSSAFPRGIAREVTPLGLWGGDVLVYRSIIVLAGLALPVVAVFGWYRNGSLTSPQVILIASILACALACHALARSGRRDIAAAILIGTLWLAVTIYAFKSGFGMHSSMIFVYLPCMLYTALFFGLGLASAMLALTIASLVGMYFAEGQGLIIGAGAFSAQGSNFNFLIGVLATSVGTLVAGAVYHRRVEREAARVVAAAEERSIALEKAQLAQAQLETAHAQLQALNRQLAERDAARTEEMSHARRDLDLLHDSVSQEIPAAVKAIRASLVTPDEGTEARLRAGLERIETVIATLDALGTRRSSPLEPVALHISQMAHEAIEQLDRALVFPGLRFDVVPGLRAHGDRKLVASLLRHLLTRAARVCRGEPDPLVRVGGGSMQGQAVLYVSDSGPGMDAARRDKLFQPFDKGARDSDTLDIAALSARHIVERHGGEMSVESAPGKGTTFFFSLPSVAS